MLIDVPGSWFFVAVLIVAPAIQRWWWARSLARVADDPALPERLAAHRVRAGQAFGVSAVLLFLGWMRWAPWTIPLLMLSCSIGNYTLRRSVYEETWSLAGYLSFCARGFTAFMGFWILLVALPVLALWPGTISPVAAASLAFALLVWNVRYPESVRLLLGVRPLGDVALLEKFQTLASKCDTAMPRFERIDLNGGAIANAIALASPRRSSVIFTDSLLARLDQDELVAICAHELAHLEYFNPRLLRRFDIENGGLIVGGLAAMLLPQFVDALSLWPGALWSLVVAATLTWRVRHRQRHETESDLRAVALTGNPEALARGLTKLYAFAQVPRRLDALAEQQSTHPSLARRIRDIRAAGASAQPRVEEAIGVKAADGRVAVTFDEDRLEWREGDAAVHQLTYAHLSELRIHARPSGPAKLVVVERAGRRWEIALDSADVARVQAALDLVDCRLPNPPAPPSPWPSFTRAITMGAAFVAMMTMHISAAIVALLAMARPSPPLLGAAGVAALAAAPLSWRESFLSTLELQPYSSIGLTLVGLGLCWCAWRARKDQPQPGHRTALAALGIIAVVAFASIFGDGFNPLRLHQAARTMPGAAIVPLAFAGALVFVRGYAARLSAAAAVLAGLAAAWAGSTQFLDRFVDDPFLVASSPIAQTTAGTSAPRTFPLPIFTTDARLSPEGRTIAARDSKGEYLDYEDGQTSTFHVGRLGETLSRISADDVVFIDENHLLAVDYVVHGGGAELSELSIDGQPTVTWRQHVDAIQGATLSIQRDSRRWRLLGWDRTNPIRAEGSIGSDAVDVTRWPGSDQGRGWPRTLAASGPDALIVATTVDVNLLPSLMPWRWVSLFRPINMASEIWFARADGYTRIGISNVEAQCVSGALTDDRLVCSAFDGTRTRILTIDPATRHIDSLGCIDGRFMSSGRVAPGWLSGWLVSTPVALRLETKELIDLSDGRHGFIGVATGDRWLGAISSNGRGSTVRLFPVE